MTNIKSIKGASLYKMIVSDTNIYNAIYSLESYVFEKGLLEDSDLKLYSQLSDKYDKSLISGVIEQCKKRIENILNSDDELFEIKPYFRMKDYKENKIRYRPIHTADLETQICLVCLLNTIMYKDFGLEDENKSVENKVNIGRHFSDISKLIPSNFYGNIPSSSADNLFINWKVKYKEYSENVINKYNEFKESKEYSHEVCLDLKDFFPSINPQFIFNYIYQKSSTIFEREEEKKCLRVVLSKLLYFKIKQEDIKVWENIYYPNIDIASSDIRMCRGIPQGLPQAYFFGNLCMIEIARIVSEIFPGNAYYYVDDSVIYTNSTEQEFEKNVISINAKCSSELQKFNKEEAILSENAKEFQKLLDYKVEFHTEGKSTCTAIDNAYENFIALQNLARQVSNAAVFNDTLDDVEDNLVKEKLDILIDAIDREIKRYSKKENNRANNGKAIKYNLKLLKRYRRFFLYRKRLLSIRNEGDVSDKILQEYYDRFQINNEELAFDTLFETIDEDIFMAESRLLLSNIAVSKKENLCGKIKDFEFRIVSQALSLNKDCKNNLYYTKDLTGTLQIIALKDKSYDTLEKWAKDLLENYSYSSDIKKKNKIHQILEVPMVDPFDSDYFKFIYNVSNEFKRKIYNALMSQILAVNLSEHLSIYKLNNRTLQYYELRILTYLRNRIFKIHDFVVFATDVLNNSREDKGLNKIDTLLFDVIHIFIKRVKNPKLVDDLILTHRLVNGLWKNGSKFLNSYTLHNEEHAVDLIKNSVRLVRAVDYLSMKELDYYILFLACYLHDISMVIHPNLAKFTSPILKSDIIASNFLLELEKELNNGIIDSVAKKIILNNFKTVFCFFENHVRDNHTKLSAEFIKQRHDSYLKFIEESTLQIIAEVAESHGYNASEVYGRRSKAQQDLYSIKYMMIVLRLADVLDMTKDRISYYILKENINQMENISQFHWISHLITDQCNIKTLYSQEDKLDNYLKNGSIQEEIVIEIILNTENLSHISIKEGCKGCESHLEKGSIIIDILDNETECSNKDKCPFLCKWVTQKHYYLFLELYELKKYLKQVNNSLFNTHITVEIKFSNSLPLDAEFFDIVKSYLEKR
ncbi:reverse transcriptase domain-containing protein [Dysgonomonas sp. ZJ709]|uniref:HD domain-containing protein n=1 Tax=Dysgonomonas sp. ZJ709 TaxID=2709797 RepID=UPI0013ECDDB4|nr:reverse transcriptase domain-containing protein [Dysgonomonas sp. ZJ709]